MSSCVSGCGCMAFCDSYKGIWSGFLLNFIGFSLGVMLFKRVAAEEMESSFHDASGF